MHSTADWLARLYFRIGRTYYICPDPTYTPTTLQHCHVKREIDLFSDHGDKTYSKFYNYYFL